MKKITLLLFALLTMSLGYSQACTGFSNETGGGSATFTNGFNYSFSTSGGNVIISFEILDTFPGLVGQLELVSGTNPGFRNMTDTNNTFDITLTDQIDGTTITFAFFGPHAGGATIRSINLDYVVGSTCTPIPAEEDVSLSDLQIDGATIAGFNKSISTYTIDLPGAGPIPQITTVTTTNPLATVGTITQAPSKPGSATFVVTSEDGTVTQTYTVNFIVTEPTVAAPTPPARPAADVISLYSDAYTDVASTFDAGWCGSNSVSEVMIAGNSTIQFLNNNCQGIVLNEGINATTFTNLHVDIYIVEDTDLTSSVFNLKFVQQPGGAALEINLNVASTPALVAAGSWLSVDVPVNLSPTFTGFKEFGITSNLNSQVWYDNLYLHKGTTLSTDNFSKTSFKTYPNPTQDSWTIETQNVRIASITVYDVLGKSVMAIEPNEDRAVIDGSTLKSGLYFAKVETAEGVSSVKLIKK